MYDFSEMLWGGLLVYQGFSNYAATLASVVIMFQVRDSCSKLRICLKRIKRRLISLLLRCIQLEAKVKIKEEGIIIPKELFKEMVGTYIKMEQILATLETLADKETLTAIEESKKQVAKGEYVECSINDLEKVLK